MQGHRHRGRAADIVQRGIGNVIAQDHFQRVERKFCLIAHPDLENQLAHNRRQEYVPALKEAIKSGCSRLKCWDSSGNLLVERSTPQRLLAQPERARFETVLEP